TQTPATTVTAMATTETVMATMPETTTVKLPRPEARAQLRNSATKIRAQAIATEAATEGERSAIVQLPTRGSATTPSTDVRFPVLRAATAMTMATATLATTATMAFTATTEITATTTRTAIAASQPPAEATIPRRSNAIRTPTETMALPRR